MVTFKNFQHILSQALPKMHADPKQSRDNSEVEIILLFWIPPPPAFLTIILATNYYPFMF